MKRKLRLLNLQVVFCPPYGTGENSIRKAQPDGSVILLYKYHERRTIAGRTWHVTLLN